MRKASLKKQTILPDPQYNDVLVTKFVNNLMLSGKKNRAYHAFYGAMEVVKQRIKDDEPLSAWKKALENVTPSVEVRSRRVGGATFQIPREIRPNRKLSMGMKWMIAAARKRNDKSMAQKLGNEIIAAYNSEGGAFKKKEDTHRMAESNKAFSHFRF